MLNSGPTSRRMLTLLLCLLMLSSYAGVSAEDAGVPTRPVPLSADATEFLRATILLLAPRTTVDEDGWGRKKRIQSGLNIRLDGLQLRTSRRWKEVNHGTWNRVEVLLEDPGQRFTLQVEIVPQKDSALSMHRIHAGGRVRLRARQQRWQNGIKLYSASAEGLADVAMTADVRLQEEVVSHDDTSRLRVLPHIESAAVRLTGFQIRRVGHAKGSLVRESSRTFESLARRLVARESDKLATRLNEKIRKKPERFEIPLGIFALLAGTPAETE